MGLNVVRFYEYVVTCDECGTEKVFHTGDYIQELHTSVHSSGVVIKAANFHRSKEKLLCGECFKSRKKSRKSR